MLSNEQIEQNKQEFLSLITSITREGANIDGLVTKLCNSDFFRAPASTQYHCNYEGGLCEHSLNVYRNYLSIIGMRQDFDECCYDEDTIKIVTLLHDISKMNIYEQYIKNNKVYCAQEESKLYDEFGHFKWVSSKEWKTKENKFVFGSHEMTSEYIARQFIPLTLDESVAILHHMGSLGWDSAQDNIAAVYSQYSLSLLLHFADMVSTYVDEREI